MPRFLALTGLLLLTVSPLQAQWCLNVNTASASELEAIVHIGPERAAQVIELRTRRPFASVDELRRVDGIGAARLADIEGQGIACVSASSDRPPPPPAAPGALAPEQPAERSCVVQRVVDGDTLDCADGRTVRLLLVDAPELSQSPFGTLAKRALEALAPSGIRLLAEVDVRPLDPYRRVLAYLILPDGRMVNEELVRSGPAVVSVYPPNVRHVERLRAASEAARAARAGFWAVDAFACLPADHRARRCP
jgi:endonuclease YncB( thermonuclease family)